MENQTWKNSNTKNRLHLAVKCCSWQQRCHVIPNNQLSLPDSRRKRKKRNKRPVFQDSSPQGAWVKSPHIPGIFSCSLQVLIYSSTSQRSENVDFYGVPLKSCVLFLHKSITWFTLGWYLRCGLPQGSVLGPLLFPWYVNDIASCYRTLSFITFADEKCY